MIDEDIDAIIQRGEERTVELNSKYEGLNLEDLNNFKSDASVQQWEGEDFRSGVSNLLVVSRLTLIECLFFRHKKQRPSTSISSLYQSVNVKPTTQSIVTSRIPYVPDHPRRTKLRKYRELLSRLPCKLLLLSLLSSESIERF